MAKKPDTDIIPEQILKEIGKGKIRPVYLIYGDEYFYVRSVVGALRHEVLKDSDPGMCLSEFNGADVAPARVFDDLRTMTFFGGRRLVIVEDAGGFLANNNPLIARYTQAPSKTGCLVLICGERPDGRLAALKEIVESGAVVSCESPKGYRIAAWVRDRVKTYGKTITQTAAETLGNIVGNDLAQLDTQLQMLATFVGERRSIEDDDVLKTVEHEKSVEIWDLMDKIAERNGKGALETFDRLLPKSGMESARLTLIGTTLIRLRTIRTLYEQLGSEDRVAKKLKLHPFVVKKSVENSRRFSREEVERGLRCILDADVAIKTNLMTPRLAVEKLIVDLCK